jgi:hypothetical protein
MTRSDILRQFKTEAGRIVGGWYDGQQLYVPYFWGAYLNGNAHDVSDDHVVLFAIHSEDRREFPELENRSVVRLKQLADGRVVEA